MNVALATRAVRLGVLVLWIFLAVIITLVSCRVIYHIGRIDQRVADEMSDWDHIEQQRREIKARMDLEMLRFKEPR